MKSFPYKTVLTVLLIAWILTGLVNGLSYIWGPEETITVQEYSVSLSGSPKTVAKYENVTFTGQLTLDGSGVSGKTVELFFSNGTSTGLTDITDANGYYTIKWNATEVGTLTFKPRATI